MGSDLIKVIQIAGESGVKHLKFKDLEITYDPDYSPQKTVDYVEESVNNDNGQQELQNEVDKLETQLVDLHLTDPLEFERLQTAGEI